MFAIKWKKPFYLFHQNKIFSLDAAAIQLTCQSLNMVTPTNPMTNTKLVTSRCFRVWGSSRHANCHHGDATTSRPCHFQRAQPTCFLCRENRMIHPSAHKWNMVNQDCGVGFLRALEVGVGFIYPECFFTSHYSCLLKWYNFFWNFYWNR